MILKSYFAMCPSVIIETDGHAICRGKDVLLIKSRKEFSSVAADSITELL